MTKWSSLSPGTSAISALLAHQAALLTRPIALLLGLAFVVHLLALCQRDLDLGASAGVEIEPERHDGYAFALDALCELGNLARLQQKLARSLRLVIEAIASKIFRNVRIVEPHFAGAIDTGIALRDRSLAGTQRLHFRAGQRDASLELLPNLVIVTSPAIIGDDLEIGFGFGSHDLSVENPRMDHRLADRDARRLRQRHHRQPHGLVHAAKHRQRIFRSGGIGL